MLRRRTGPSWVLCSFLREGPQCGKCLQIVHRMISMQWSPHLANFKLSLCASDLQPLRDGQDAEHRPAWAWGGTKDSLRELVRFRQTGNPSLCYSASWVCLCCLNGMSVYIFTYLAFENRKYVWFVSFQGSSFGWIFIYSIYLLKIMYWEPVRWHRKYRLLRSILTTLVQTSNTHTHTQVFSKRVVCIEHILWAIFCPGTKDIINGSIWISTVRELTRTKILNK